MSSRPSSFRLPDLFPLCHIEDRTNPHYDKAWVESRTWLTPYIKDFSERKRIFIQQTRIELLCSHVYPWADYERFRTACDYMNLLFVVDEVTDDQDGRDARATSQVFVTAMRSPNWDDGSIAARITREFKARFDRLASPRNKKRFEDAFEEYMKGVTEEAELRERGQTPNLESYIPLRRNNSGVLTTLIMAEHQLGVDLEDDVFKDGALQEVFLSACDFVCWSNDLYSYDMEQSRGLNGNNVTSVLMEQYSWTLQEAVDHIGHQCAELMEKYLDAKRRLSPSLGEDARKFADAIGYWMVGNLYWSFESLRYFGCGAAQVKKTGIVRLRALGAIEAWSPSDTESSECSSDADSDSGSSM